MHRTPRLCLVVWVGLTLGCTAHVDVSPSEPPFLATRCGTSTLSAASAAALSLRAPALGVSLITSDGATLSWDAVPGASALTLYLAPAPFDESAAAGTGGVLEATLAADATGYTLTAIAAATDFFVELVADIDGASEIVGTAHVRTVGGPRATLATALREVHAYGPRVLGLVVANPDTYYDGTPPSGDVGNEWAAGTWSVQRADGTSVAVTSVARHSIPVSQPDYKVGFNQFGDDKVVDIDHRIFLTLGERIGNVAWLHVTHTGTAATALDVRVPFSDCYLETPLIQINQVGYNPRATHRWAYVSGWLGSGGAADLSDLFSSAEVIVEPSDGRAARTVAVTDLPITERQASSPFAGGEVREIDLASVPAFEGVRYRVRIPGVGVSYPTAVSEAAALKSYYVTWRGLFHNRWCGDLGDDYTDWSRGTDHCSAYFVQLGRVAADGFFPTDTPTDPATRRDVIGGHHDAGDFDIRPYHVVVAQYLLRGFELARDAFPDSQLTIPESGNGIPDALDEGLWSVAAWQALQNADGSVRSGVESYRHPPGVYYADDDALPYFTFNPEPWHTAYVAALFAQAAYLVRPYDNARSSSLEDAARRAFSWASGHGAPTSYLLYAASELARLTGESTYFTAFETHWNALDKWGGGAFDTIQIMPKIYPGAFTGYAPAMADFVMGYAEATGADSAIVATIDARLTENAEAAATRILESSFAHRHGRDPSTAPDWGVDVATGRDGDMIYQRLELGGISEEQRQRYFDALSVSADYVLGCNPASYSYITGLGTRSPREPLHLDSLAFIKDKGMLPVPGIPTYGPVQNFPGPSYYAPLGAAFSPSFNEQPVGLHLTDARAAVNMSEFTVWEMSAPLAELFAALVTPTMLPPTAWRPGGPLQQSPLP